MLSPSDNRPERPRCCVPDRILEARQQRSRIQSENRIRATDGCLTDMTRLDGGTFQMGSDSPDTFAADGEGPVRLVRVSPFYMSRFAVTNWQFREFVRDADYVSEAERIGWSFVFHRDAPSGCPPLPGAPWWRVVQGASWKKPEGPGSSVSTRLEHPVIHVSWNDAQAFCDWAGYRLPTEAEWEFACRGGLEGKLYPWGDELTPGGEHRCNIWQGDFPDIDRGEDGFAGVAPVSALPPNAFGLLNMTGNVWEWVADYFGTEWQCDATHLDPVGPPNGDAHVIRGGSYLCHASYCNRYRNSGRSANTPNSSTANMGFRVARDLS